MRLGLGTGSTTAFAIEAIGRRVREQDLDVVGVPTSFAAERLARHYGVPLVILDELGLDHLAPGEAALDLALDGADEVDPALNLIKGRGAAQTREKVVASLAARFVVLIDPSKEVDQLGTTMPVPVEVLPNSLELIPPPPIDGSTAFALDKDVSMQSLALQGTARWTLAAQDADLVFPQAAGTFSCALNAPITEQETPQLYMLLRRTLADAGLSTYTAKNHYNRTRPFVVNNEPICTPEEEEALMNDGSYPSGHTAIGWAWALILTEISPELTDEILARGWAFGQSRTICNVHWQSDVMMGRIMGATSVASLHSDPEFRAAIEAARKELESARARGLQPTRDCQAESDALKEYPSLAPWPANK